MDLKDMIYEVRAKAKHSKKDALIAWFDSNMRYIHTIFTFYDPSLSINNHHKKKFDELEKLFIQLDNKLDEESSEKVTKDSEIKTLTLNIEKILQDFSIRLQEGKDVDIRPLFEKLEKLGFTIKNHRLYEKTGLNNFLFFIDAETKEGPFPLLVKMSEKKEKLENEQMGLELLNSHSHLDIPLVKIVTSGKLGRYTYIVMQYVESKTLRELKNDVELVTKTAELLARIHTIKVGHIGKFHDKKQSWFEYLYSITLESLNTVYEKGYGHYFQKGDSIEESKTRLKAELENYLDSYRSVVEDAPMRFVHTDFNFHNVLVTDKKISGVIDTEFWIGGDPAWEFNGMDLEKAKEPYEHNKEFITAYLKMAKELDPTFDVHDFLLRYRIYTPLRNIYYAAVFTVKRPDLVEQMIKFFEEDFERMKKSDNNTKWFDNMFMKHYSHI